MIKRILYISFFVLLVSSCVTNKKYQYLQKDDVNVKQGVIPKDSILRTYPLDDFEYHLQPEDILSIQFYSLTTEEFDFFALKQTTGAGSGSQAFSNAGNALVNGYLIDEEGEVEFPVVGKVKIEGLTVFEAQNHIQNIADKYLDRPVVEVRLLNFRFTILGEVKREGVYNSLNNRIHVLEAIGISGGFTDFADKSNVKIIRQNGRTAEVYYLNLLDEKLLQSPQYYINQLDVMIVAPLKQRPYQVYFGKNLALIISSVSLLLIVLNLIK
jgi:polysaccharide biosynthesis/export protein